MAYTSSSIMVDSSPPGSPGPSSQQHRLLNRVSTLFGGGKKQKNSTSSIMTDNESIAASQVDSMMMDDRTASCVDSMYSSLQSRRSNYRPPPNPNVPAPLRTVQLDNPIVHLPTPPPPSTSTPLEQHTVKPSPSQTYSTPLHTPSPPPTTTIVADKRSSKSKTTAQKIEDIETQFNLLMREYAPSASSANNVLNLTFEQKEELIRSSKSPDLQRKNSSFSNVMPAFSLKATFGIKSSKKNKGFSDYTIANTSFMNEDDSFSDFMTSVKANTAPGRHGKSRSALPTNGFQSYGRKTTRSKLKSTPEYFVHLLRETHVRDLQDNEVLQLQVFLRNVVVSWTSEFLAKGGYDAIANLFEQMKEAPKRFPNDNRILQHLGKCLKTIMTHQPMGTQIVLTNPIALHHVRDILFGPANKKQKQVYGLDISTRGQLLNLLCTLATIQTNRTSEYEYVHGYDVLRRLLLNKATDKIEDDDDKKNQQKHVSPFPITLKTDPKEILQMIMEKDPNGQAIGQDYQWDHDELKPRYTAWMRELHFTVEKHIETITFLASALNYNFDSAYRQIKMRQDQADYESESSNGTTVMCEEGVVDYIVTHLRLIRTVVTTQPTSYTGNYDNREQEKMRLELMMSGFDRISKILIQCPHPMIRSSYINYLKPLMNPCADLSAPVAHPFPEAYYEQPMQDSFHHQESDDDQVTYEEVSVYAQQDSEEMEDVQESHDRQWRYDDDPYYDDIFYDDDEEDRFDEDGMSDVSMGTYHTEEHHYYGNPNYYTATST